MHKMHVYYIFVRNTILLHHYDVMQKWPPPKEVDYKPPEAKLEPSGVSVLKKWQPDTKSESKPTTPTSPGN